MSLDVLGSLTNSGVVLFDLDDTLILATDLKKAVPIFQTHTGYATVVKVGTMRMFVAIRPFAIASIVILLNAGYQVGFWSAGSPPYVQAIVSRLVDAVRLMQAKKSKARNMLSFKPFTPIAVMSLDHGSLQWVRHPGSEQGVGGEAKPGQPSPLQVIMTVTDADITKYMDRVASQHPALARYVAEKNIVLIDNLPQDASFTHTVAPFVGKSKDNTLDKTLLELSRTLARQRLK
jgi:hypothetical protein